MATKHVPDTSLQIEVLTAEGEPLNNAQITLRSTDSKGKSVKAVYDSKTFSYLVKKVPAGAYEIKVSHSKLEGQSRNVTLGVSPNREIFILGKKGERHTSAKK
jgi:hypothetical protein